MTRRERPSRRRRGLPGDEIRTSSSVRRPTSMHIGGGAVAINRGAVGDSVLAQGSGGWRGEIVPQCAFCERVGGEMKSKRETTAEAGPGPEGHRRISRLISRTVTCGARVLAPTRKFTRLRPTPTTTQRTREAPRKVHVERFHWEQIGVTGA